MITEALRVELGLMLAEMESHRLEVMLVPARWETNAGACVRVAVSKNCTWYRAFCGRHASSRRRTKAAFDTRIRRRDVERLLARLIAAGSRSKYAEELMAVAQRRVRSALPAERIAC